MRRPQGGSMGLQATGRWGDWGVRRALTAFTILEQSSAKPPDIPRPRAALRSKLCIGNEAPAPLANV